MTRSLTTPDSLFDFFHDHVRLAGRDAPLDLHGDTLVYLAQLLAERARSDPAASGGTLAELHGAAAHAPPGEQASTYRELGDRALYLLGFFREHLDRARRPIGPRYYADMGAAAYGRCDQVLKRWFADAFGPVFHELSRNFEGCVALLTDVKRTAGPGSPGLAAAYERWLLASVGTPTDTEGSGIILLGRTPTS